MSCRTAGFLDNLTATNGKVITCKAAVAWEAKAPLDVTEIQVDPPRAGEVRVKAVFSTLIGPEVQSVATPAVLAIQNQLGHPKTPTCSSLVLYGIGDSWLP